MGRPANRVGFGAVGVVATLVALCAPSDADADAPTWPVVVTSRGPKPMLVEVSAGYVLPCDGSPMLYRGWLQPDTALIATSPTPYVCVRHTYEDFPTVDWSQSVVLHAPRACRRRHCWPIPNAPIRAEVRSDRDLLAPSW
jgi:hypothetical protein